MKEKPFKNMEDKRIAIIGDGGWGTALGILLSHKGLSVKLWGWKAEYVDYMKKQRENAKFLSGVKIPESIFISNQMDEVIQSAEIIVLAVPSQYLRNVLEKLKGLELPDAIFLSVTKGIENKTLKRPSELIEEVLGGQRIVVLSGPSIALEVAKEIPTTVVVSSKEEAIALTIQQTFMTERFRIYTNDDLIGVELAGALKNIIAIACGISDGLGFGTNAKAALLTRGLVEIKRLGLKLGAKVETFNGVAGVGDLVTTCISPYGRNRFVGEEIGKGKTLKQILNEMEMVAEGIKTTESVYQLALKFNIEMPITEQVHAVLFEDKNPLETVSDLMKRKAKPENGENGVRS